MKLRNSLVQASDTDSEGIRFILYLKLCNGFANM